MNKDAIRHTFIGQYLISWLHIVECRVMPRVYDDETAVKKFFKKKTGYELDLENPKTFSEKMNWYKLNDRNPLMAKCADKVAVREYIKEKGYGDMLNEIYGVYNKVSEIDIDALPDKFVLKAAHGSHMNVIVTDKSQVNWRQQKMLMSTWLKQDIYWSGREWVYKDIPKRIVAEKYLEDSAGELKDYKFFCFNGKPCYMQYDVGRYNGNHYRNYYDMNLNFIDVNDDVQSNPNLRPAVDENQIKKMIEISENLSKPFQMVRVDFYYCNNKIYFGELTFFHNGGIGYFSPAEFDDIIGEKWNIEICT